MESELSPCMAEAAAGGCAEGEEALREGGGGAAFPWKPNKGNSDLHQLY